jgi:hypothetical protein
VANGCRWECGDVFASLVILPNRMLKSPMIMGVLWWWCFCMEFRASCRSSSVSFGAR